MKRDIVTTTCGRNVFKVGGYWWSHRRYNRRRPLRYISKRQGPIAKVWLSLPTLSGSDIRAPIERPVDRTMSQVRLQLDAELVRMNTRSVERRSQLSSIVTEEVLVVLKRPLIEVKPAAARQRDSGNYECTTWSKNLVRLRA